jgi:hypothetical protein
MRPFCVKWGINCITPAFLFILTVLTISCASSTPSISISDPTSGQSIPFSSDVLEKPSLSIAGKSNGVHQNQNLRIYVLAHPSNFPKWFILQPQVPANSDGTWSGRVQFNTYEYKPKSGDSIEVVAVIADPSNFDDMLKLAASVSDPKDLKPSAQSNVIKLDVSPTK